MEPAIRNSTSSAWYLPTLSGLWLLLAVGCKTTLPPDIDQALDRVCQESIARGEIPGAVLVVGRHQDILKQKAYGQRVVAGKGGEALTLDTIFDLASLTKVVGTATALAILLEDGLVKLDDPVVRYVQWWPDKSLTLRHLATHTSGFAPYLPAKEVRTRFPDLTGNQAVLRAIAAHKRRYPMGEGFSYSCLNYLLLAHVLEKACGKNLEELLRQRVWAPLGMHDTTWRLAPGKKERCAPTENGLRGRVHDPLAALYGTENGMPGNAGLFSTGPDLARFMAALSCGGVLGSTRILKTETVQALFANQAPPSSDSKRGLGWVIPDRPKYLPFPGKFTVRYHKGFTGTFLWIDLESGVYVVLLTSRLYPKRGNAEPIRSKVVQIVAKEYIPTLHSRT